MEGLVTSRASWRSGQNTKLAERKCHAIARVTEKYTRLAAVRALGIDDGFAIRAISRALGKQGCTSSTPMTVFPVTMTSSGDRLEDTLVLPGAYESYVPAFESAINNSNSSTSAASAIDAVISSASGSLGAGDMAALEMIATLGVASTPYWYDFEASGGLSRMLDSLREYETAVLPLPRRIGFWKALGWGDLVGFAAGVVSAVTYSGGTILLVPSAGLIAGTAGAVGASAGAVLGFM